MGLLHELKGQYQCNKFIHFYTHFHKLYIICLLLHNTIVFKNNLSLTMQ